MQRQEGDSKVPRVTVGGQGRSWALSLRMSERASRYGVHCSAASGKREERGQQGSGSSSCLLDPWEVGSPARTSFPRDGKRDQLGVGSAGNPTASPTCRISASLLAWAQRGVSSWAGGYKSGDKPVQVKRRGPALCQGPAVLVLLWSTGVRQVRPVPGALDCNHPSGQQQPDLGALAKETSPSPMRYRRQGWL